jgi:hypothetical protein
MSILGDALDSCPDHTWNNALLSVNIVNGTIKYIYSLGAEKRLSSICILKVFFHVTRWEVDITN